MPSTTTNNSNPIQFKYNVGKGLDLHGKNQHFMECWFFDF